MRTPKHGVGKLRSGNPGNSGRPSSETRAKFRECADLALAEAMRRLRSKTLAKTLTVAELRDLADVCGKFGVGTQNRIDVRDLSDEQIVALLNDDA